MNLVRRATALDLPFMRDMLYEAAAVSWVLQGIEPPARGDLLAHSSNLRYLEGWGRTGDAGVIAESTDGSARGAAWYRLYTPAERGDGIIAEPGVPELAIGVSPEARSRGAGAALLQALLRVAGKSGFERLGLSVDPANPARRLYARCGFRELPSGNPYAGTSILMQADAG
jgi:ribosomal protein S18 acetylase RimI-like enzyme